MKLKDLKITQEEIDVLAKKYEPNHTYYMAGVINRIIQKHNDLINYLEERDEQNTN